MPLLLFKRRHSPTCLKRLTKQLPAITPHQLQQHGDCDCAWWIRGVTDEGVTILPRSLKAKTRAAAERAARELNQPTARTLMEPPRGNPITPTTPKEAFTAWQAESESLSPKDSTLKQQRLIARYVEEYAAIKGYVYVHQFLPADITNLRLTWKQQDKKDNTRITYFTVLKQYFDFCWRNYLLFDNPAKRVPRMSYGSNRKTSVVECREDEESGTLPLDLEGDETYRKVLGAVRSFLAGRLQYINDHGQVTTSPFNEHPENFIALLELMYETGLRVSDAIHFNVDRMLLDADGGVYTTVQIKTGHGVTVFPPRWLAEKLPTLPRLRKSKYIFFDGRGDWKGFINSIVRRPLSDLGDFIGVPNLRPHRFRDSFAVNWINERQNPNLHDLKELLGHRRLETTERYYLPFVKSRKDALRRRTIQEREAGVLEFRRSAR